MAEDEAIGDDVVAILGSARVNGRVDGAVVAVAGSVYLGPKANVRGDVTAVGGSVERADGTVVSGQINEIRIARPTFGPLVTFRPWAGWHWFGDTVRNPFGGSVDLVATLVRIGLVGLLAALMVAVRAGPRPAGRRPRGGRALARGLRRPRRATPVRAAAGDHRRDSRGVHHRHSAAAAGAVRPDRGGRGLRHGVRRRKLCRWPVDRRAGG